MTGRLTEANAGHEERALAEVESLLVTLGQTWQETLARQSMPAAQPGWLPSRPLIPGIPSSSRSASNR